MRHYVNPNNVNQVPIYASRHRVYSSGMKARTDMTQHTPGPWTAHDDDGTGTMPCVLANQITTYGNFYVAQCHVFENARLIAAAPDLLAALVDATQAIENMQAEGESRYHPIVTAAKAAIAKATG